MPWETVTGKLADVRKEAGYDRIHAAKAIGCAESQMWRWERGKSMPSLAHAHAMARLYGVTLETIAEAFGLSACAAES